MKKLDWLNVSLALFLIGFIAFITAYVQNSKPRRDVLIMPKAVQNNSGDPEGSGRFSFPEFAVVGGPEGRGSFSFPEFAVVGGPEGKGALGFPDAKGISSGEGTVVYQ